MGITGVGKSSFISYFSNTAVTGDGLESCTSTVSIHAARVAGMNIFLIDTPGFDDTNRSDTDILREIATWLDIPFKRSIKLAGIIYLHRITDNRLSGSALKNLRLFRKLCGDGGLSCVVLATTMWNMVTDQSVAVQREAELKSNPEFWQGLIAKGSVVLRQDNGKLSAIRIIQHILSKKKRGTLAIQDEMNSGKDLSQTKVGLEVGSELAMLEKKYKEEIEKLKRELQEARRERDLRAELEIANERAAQELMMKKVQEDKRRLEVNVEELQKEAAQRWRPGSGRKEKSKHAKADKRSCKLM
ncbi:P-loop containing nucleoside triphosphate hydrolase protein [Apodospora peruviana]|uniref:P-loop containing nucleoside triphosphate hydrolase protein n=1 Tax=Apodospora peruviana TaxID=516989 RepID=A0AAE0IHJ8_9PEZI|nr:P-loop containing nucleoside triphosphate hydrolase protein [Apodospora peruviana]